MTTPADTSKHRKNLSALSNALLAALCLSLIAGLVYFFIKTEAVELREKGEILGLLRELRSIDMEWDVRVLRAHSSLVPDRTLQLERAGPATHTLERIALVALKARSHALDEGLAALRQAFSEKAELVQTFNHENTAARRALQSGLSLSEQAAARSHTARRVVPRWQEQGRRAEVAARDLAAAMLRYHHTPSTAQRRALDDAAGRFVVAADHMPDPLGDIAAGITRQLQKLYQYRPAEEKVFQKLAFATAGPRVDALTRELNREFDQTLAEKDRFRVYLACCALALLVLLAYLGARVRLSYVERERQLVERTRELSEKLERLGKSGDA